jgi:hypothetical protein
MNKLKRYVSIKEGEGFKHKGHPVPKGTEFIEVESPSGNFWSGKGGNDVHPIKDLSVYRTEITNADWFMEIPEIGKEFNDVSFGILASFYANLYRMGILKYGAIPCGWQIEISAKYHDEIKKFYFIPKTPEEKTELYEGDQKLKERAKEIFVNSYPSF